jgi:hypothetical protein
MDEKEERAPMSLSAPKKTASKEIVADDDGRVQRIPPGRKLPYWEPPRSKTQAVAWLRNGMREWASHTLDNIYKWGAILEWLSIRAGHGGMLDLYAELKLKKNNAENWRRFYRECKEHNRIVVPHWVRQKMKAIEKAKGKSTTVVPEIATHLLASPDDDESREKPQKPKHEPGASKEWNATECGHRLLSRYDRLVSGRTEEERKEVLTIFAELAEDANRELSQSRRLIREGGGRIIDEDGEGEE